MICIISTDDFSWGQHYFVLKYEEILVFWCVWCLTQCFRASLPVMFHCLCCLILILKTEARGKGGAASGGGNSWRGGGNEKKNFFFFVFENDQLVFQLQCSWQSSLTLKTPVHPGWAVKESLSGPGSSSPSSPSSFSQLSSASSTRHSEVVRRRTVRKGFSDDVFMIWKCPENSLNK